jgi:hypothetical protein
MCLHKARCEQTRKQRELQQRQQVVHHLVNQGEAEESRQQTGQYAVGQIGRASCRERGFQPV